jgi:hypothetical protein
MHTLEARGPPAADDMTIGAVLVRLLVREGKEGTREGYVVVGSWQTEGSSLAARLASNEAQFFRNRNCSWRGVNRKGGFVTRARGATVCAWPRRNPAQQGSRRSLGGRSWATCPPSSWEVSTRVPVR